MNFHAAAVWLALTIPGHPAARPPVHPAMHDTHVSHTRMAIGDSMIVARVRLFRDDLERGLRKLPGQAERSLTRKDRADSLFAVYAGGHLALTADGSRLEGRVLASGLEQDEAAQEVVWYVLQYPIGRVPDRLVVRNALLFEVFDSQQNIMAIQAEPGDRRFSLYFTASDTTAQVIRLQ
jgi:hypothetical protein